MNLTLPSDHPIAKLEPGQRARRARELLDFALAFEREINELKSVIMARFDEIEAKITASAAQGSGDECSEESKPKVEIDPLDLLNF